MQLLIQVSKRRRQREAVQQEARGASDVPHLVEAGYLCARAKLNVAILPGGHHRVQMLNQFVRPGRRSNQRITVI
jgi:hypothetical protein